MRSTVLLLFYLLVYLAVASFDMSNTNDKELAALLSDKWYDLLPAKVITERANLLKLLAPATNATAAVSHA